ncbi:MAG: hypothetical protein JWL83_904 [Actinomycetia bacterium]|nr:hypothetical protein [Actinomycetes bacterium]
MNVLVVALDVDVFASATRSTPRNSSPRSRRPRRGLNRGSVRFSQCSAGSVWHGKPTVAEFSDPNLGSNDSNRPQFERRFASEVDGVTCPSLRAA